MDKFQDDFDKPQTPKSERKGLATLAKYPNEIPSTPELMRKTEETAQSSSKNDNSNIINNPDSHDQNNLPNGNGNEESSSPGETNGLEIYVGENFTETPETILADDQKDANYQDEEKIEQQAPLKTREENGSIENVENIEPRGDKSNNEEKNSLFDDEGEPKMEVSNIIHF